MGNRQIKGRVPVGVYITFRPKYLCRGGQDSQLRNYPTSSIASFVFSTNRCTVIAPKLATVGPWDCLLIGRGKRSYGNCAF